MRPLLATATLGFAGVFSFLAFFAVWAVSELGASPRSVGLAFSAAAVTGSLGAVVGGRLSDSLGRKPVIVVAAAGQTMVAPLLLLPVGPVGGFAVLAALSFLQPLRGATQRAAAVDLAPPGRVEPALAALRIAVNLGGSGGALLGSLLLTGGWTALQLGTAALFAGSLVAALRLPADRVAAGVDRTPPVGLGRLLAQPALALVLAATTLAWVVYQAFETVLPVTLVAGHGFAPAAWGVVFAVNPALTVLFQLRVTRWSAQAAVTRKLTLALALMSAPFAFVSLAGTHLAVILGIVVVVTIGEMLWAPASEALVAEVAPSGSRGSAMGLGAAASWLGTALGPAGTLQVGSFAGESAMWASVCVAAAAAALLYARAGRPASDLAPGARRAPAATAAR